MSQWSFLPPESIRSGAPVREGSEVLLVRWDPALGVALISHPWGLTLGSVEELEGWRAELFAKLESVEKTRGGRFPIVVCVDGLTIRPSVAQDYGKVARSYSQRFATGLARFTVRPNGVGQIITVAAMTEGYRANLFTSRGAAVAHARSNFERDGNSKA